PGRTPPPGEGPRSPGRSPRDARDGSRSSSKAVRPHWDGATPGSGETLARHAIKGRSGRQFSSLGWAAVAPGPGVSTPRDRTGPRFGMIFIGPHVILDLTVGGRHFDT